MNNKLGEIAIKLIGDYPLYASTNGITYPEAIAIAKVLFGNDLIAVKRESDRWENLSLEEKATELKKTN
jgi:hypothetical protein